MLGSGDRARGRTDVDAGWEPEMTALQSGFAAREQQACKQTRVPVCVNTFTAPTNFLGVKIVRMNCRIRWKKKLAKGKETTEPFFYRSSLLVAPEISHILSAKLSMSRNNIFSTVNSTLHCIHNNPCLAHANEVQFISVYNLVIFYIIYTWQTTEVCTGASLAPWLALVKPALRAQNRA